MLDLRASLLPQLRSLRTALDNPETLAPAFRLAEALLPTLRVEAPHMVPRLASCFYWATVETGPDDVLRYQRAFGNPPHDPHFHRLRALAYERAANLTEAHKYWQPYENLYALSDDAQPMYTTAPYRELMRQCPPYPEPLPMSEFGLFGEGDQGLNSAATTTSTGIEPTVVMSTVSRAMATPRS